MNKIDLLIWRNVFHYDFLSINVKIFLSVPCLRIIRNYRLRKKTICKMCPFLNKHIFTFLDSIYLIFEHFCEPFYIFLLGYAMSIWYNISAFAAFVVSMNIRLGLNKYFVDHIDWKGTRHMQIFSFHIYITKERYRRLHFINILLYLHKSISIKTK